ncbi:DUF58 domain-containing protein [Alteromonas sp. ASW11-36]|uniref:DUF58 domain-containing protein n=1 Tax=Alteromonas arenosi TaxID=3055817 RepID=A0ABT7SYA2_9ALTE|nr:DUF58 domain-containing protein [Alteromonas sp. ASW11-36]MDM7861178.1 DUF58 domain-containing protein [Alteromonas sp. ASW11-36]
MLLANLQRAWRKRMDDWLNRRIPAAHKQQLDLRSIFILPSRFGWLYLLLCISLFVLGTNYQNNLMLILCFVMLAILLINLHASYWNFARLCLMLKAIPPGYANSQVTAKLHLNAAEHQKSASGEIRVSTFGDDEYQVIDADCVQSVDLKLQLPERGIHRLPRLTIESFFPLGLYRCWTHLDFNTHLVVFPAPQRCELKLYALPDENEQEGSLVAQPGTEDFEGLRRYVVGDNLNRVAWKHVAKQQQWLSKNFESYASVSGFLKLPMVDAVNLEQELAKLAHQINVCSQQNVSFGLDLGGQKLAPATGEAHRIKCLTALAAYPDNTSEVRL